jgi:signal transduction histidine kinase
MRPAAWVKRFAARLHGLPLAAKLPAFVALLTFAVALATTQVALSLSEQREDLIHSQAAGMVLDGVRGSVEPYLDGGVAAVERALARKLKAREGVRIAALQVTWRDASGTQFAASVVESRAGSDLSALAARAFVSDRPEQVSWQARGDVAIAVQPAAVSGGPGVRAVLDLTPLNAQRRADRWLFVAINIALAAVGALIAFLYVRRVLTPVYELTERLSAEKITEAPDHLAQQPMTTEVGQLQRVLAHRLEMERERNAAYQELAERERAESLAAIAASLAHEVRNPLAGLLNGVSTLRRFGDDTNVRAQTVDLIERGLRSLERVTTAALSTYRPPDEQRGFTNQDLADLIVLVAPEGRRRGVELAREGELTRPLVTDANALRQVLLNLLLNAVRATPDGGWVRLRVRDFATAVSFQVIDTGNGLPEAIRAFLRGEDDGRLRRGQGLGLWTARRLVDEIGGRLSAASRPGGGTSVTVTIVDGSSEERSATAPTGEVSHDAG